MSTKRIATLKRGRGGVGYRQKRCFLKLRMDTDRKRLFCSNVSTLLSMIVGSCIKIAWAGRTTAVLVFETSPRNQYTSISTLNNLLRSKYSRKRAWLPKYNKFIHQTPHQILMLFALQLNTVGIHFHPRRIWWFLFKLSLRCNYFEN